MPTAGLGPWSIKKCQIFQVFGALYDKSDLASFPQFNGLAKSIC